MTNWVKLQNQLGRIIEVSEDRVKELLSQGFKVVDEKELTKVQEGGEYLPVVEI